MIRPIAHSLARTVRASACVLALSACSGTEHTGSGATASGGSAATAVVSAGSPHADTGDSGGAVAAGAGARNSASQGAAGRGAAGTGSAGVGQGSAAGAKAAGSGGNAAPAADGGTGQAGASANAGAGGGSAGDWPQCYADGKVPADDAMLKQRAPSADFKTQIAFGGVAMILGPNRQACITDQVANFDVKDLHGEIKDVVEGLGFPAFPDWANGYYMNWVVLNSGIPNATLASQGGHQGDRYGHMNFESTEECPCNWGTGNDSNRGNALHESIHALQAELWAFNNQASGWIHEAHNCYLGTQRTHIVYDQYTMGYGAAASLQMPHIPIESMGVLTDDTVAGPADQLANGKTYVDSIVRYGHEIFFLSLNLEMGRGFINCMWMDAAKLGNGAKRVSSTKSVFQVIQSYAGAAGAAHAVLSFGARGSLLDFAGWTPVVRTTMQSNWKNNWWFYMFPGGDGTMTFSPPAKQIPHHQGRNIIPIKLAAGATSVTVELMPDAMGSKGTKQSMQGQLTYRTTDDMPVYGTAFSSGQNTLAVPNGARNGIVNFVVAVTNANADSGGDDGSNKGFDGQEKFNYKARIVSGGTIAPTTTRPW